MLLPVVATSAGVLLLFGGWQGRLRPRWAADAAGWLVLVASLALWSVELGAEFGVTLGLFAFALPAWLLVIANRRFREPKGRRSEIGTLAMPGRSAVLRHSAMFLATVPLACAAGAFLALGLASLLWQAPVDRMAIGSVLSPLLWGLFAFWALMDRSFARPVIAMAAVVAAGALLVFP